MAKSDGGQFGSKVQSITDAIDAKTAELDVLRAKVDAANADYTGAVNDLVKLKEQLGQLVKGYLK